MVHPAQTSHQIAHRAIESRWTSVLGPQRPQTYRPIIQHVPVGFKSITTYITLADLYLRTGIRSDPTWWVSSSSPPVRLGVPCPSSSDFSHAFTNTDKRTFLRGQYHASLYGPASINTHERGPVTVPFSHMSPFTLRSLQIAITVRPNGCGRSSTAKPGPGHAQCRSVRKWLDP